MLKHSPRGLANVSEWKIIFDSYIILLCMLPYTNLLNRRTLVLDKNPIKSMSPETKLLPKMHYDALNILTPKTKDKRLFKHANRTHFGGTLCFGRYQVAPFQCGLQPTATIIECANHGQQLNISRNDFYMF